MYKTVYARLRRSSITEEAFNAWKAEARRRLDETRKTGASVEEYIAWLKKGSSRIFVGWSDASE